MENKKDDKYYANKMVEHIETIERYYKVIKEKNSELKNNDQDSDAILYKFIQLKEDSNNISDETINELGLYDDIKYLRAFRNRITHDYENVSYSFIAEIINNDLPRIKNKLLEIIRRI